MTRATDRDAANEPRTTTRDEPRRQRRGHDDATATTDQPLARLHRRYGNQAVQRLAAGESSPVGGASREAYEHEADRVAEAVTETAAPTRSHGTSENRDDVPARTSEQIRAIRHGGRALPNGLRSVMESRFGRDFGDVRIHTGARAGEAARALDATAFTAGRRIAFRAGAFQPETSAGRRLLAHELTHTIQQRESRRAVPAVQRQAETETAAESRVTARDVFPFPEGSRVLLTRIMPDALYETVRGQVPQQTAALEALDAKQAVVETATEDRFEAVVGGSVTVPGDQGDVTYRDITVTFSRQGENGGFDFRVEARVGDQPSPTTLLARSGLTATRSGGEVVLSTGRGEERQRQIAVGRGEEGGVRVAGFTAPLDDQLDAGDLVKRALKFALPERIELIGMDRLPDPGSSADVEAEAAEIRERERERRRTKRRTVSGQVGTMAAGGGLAPLLGAAWEIRVPFPGEALGQYLSVPLELRLQYAPRGSVLGGASSGVEGRLPSSVPVTLRLVAGVAGGRVDAPSGTTGARGVVGPTVGVGGGIELNRWRIALRYEHLFSLLEASPDVDTAALSVGFDF